MMAGARSPAFLLFFLASYGVAWVTIQRADNIVGLGSTFDAGDADALPQGNITISVSYRQYLPFRSTWSVKLFRTAAPIYDIALYAGNDGATIAEAFFDSSDFDFGPAPWFNETLTAPQELKLREGVMDWHRFTISYDKAADLMLFFVDGAVVKNLTAGLSSSATAGVLSPEATPALFLGIYADWSLQDDGTGVLTFTSSNQRPYGQYDELAVWSRALAPEDVAALAAGDEERRSGVDAALSLDPSLLYDFSVPADADGAWPNQGFAGERYAVGGGQVAWLRSGTSSAGRSKSC